MIDVVICTYNGEQRISEMLFSVLNHIHNISDIIIVDNNCTDNTVELCKSIIPSCKVVKEYNQGLAFARKAGYNNCTSDFILFVDDDNVLDNNYTDTLLLNMSDNAACCGLSIGDFETVIGNKNIEKFIAVGVPDKFLWGAGLMVRKSILDIFYKNFNHILVDRDGAKLSSGSDTELMAFTSLLGYKQSVIKNTNLIHKIPKKRCSTEYLSELCLNLGEVSFVIEFFYGDGDVDKFERIKTIDQIISTMRTKALTKRCFDNRESYLYSKMDEGYRNALKKYSSTFNKQKKELYDKFDSLHLLDK